jgi:hypothetical protein
MITTTTLKQTHYPTTIEQLGELQQFALTASDREIQAVVRRIYDQPQEYITWKDQILSKMAQGSQDQRTRYFHVFKGAMIALSNRLPTDHFPEQRELHELIRDAEQASTCQLDFTRLPPEVQTLLCARMPTKELLGLGSTSSKLHKLCSINTVWKEHARRDRIALLPGDDCAKARVLQYLRPIPPPSLLSRVESAVSSGCSQVAAGATAAAAQALPIIRIVASTCYALSLSSNGGCVRSRFHGFLSLPRFPKGNSISLVLCKRNLYFPANAAQFFALNTQTTFKATTLCRILCYSSSFVLHRSFEF